MRPTIAALLCVCACVLTHADTGEACPASALIDAARDGVLPFPDMYFSAAQLAAPHPPALPCRSFSRVRGHATYPDSVQSSLLPRVTHRTRHSCVPRLCPLAWDSAEATAAAATWPARAPAICALNSPSPRRVRVVVLGGSMTKGEDAAGVCCTQSSPKCAKNTSVRLRRGTHYCNWAGFFATWLHASFPHVRFEVINLAQNGVGSGTMAREASTLLHMHNLTLGSDDILLLDHSCNDAAGVTARDVEMLVRQVLLFSSAPPTLLLVEQWMHADVAGELVTDKRYIPTPGDAFLYVPFYRAVARHYRLPVFSYYELMWSERMRNGSTALSDALIAYPLHPPWHVHLFIADALAAYFKRLLRDCARDPELRSPVGPLPRPLTDIRTLERNTCNATAPPLMESHPTSAYRPPDLAAFELGLRGWTEYADRHGVPGWIINRHAPLGNRTLTFALPDPPREHRLLLLRLKYLRTHRDAGMVELTVCGGKVGQIDALFQFVDRRVSVPQLFTYTLSTSELRRCVREGAARLVVEYIGGPEGRVDRRTHMKFKLLGVSLCYASDSN